MFQKFQVTIHHYFQIKILINLSVGFSSVVQKVRVKYRITIVGFLEVLKI